MAKTTAKAKAKPKPKAKPKKKSAKAERGLAKPGPKPKYEMIDLYLDSVAANQQGLGLARALEMSVDMFQYEFRVEYEGLQKEARRVLDTRDAEAIVVLAKRKKVPLDEAAVTSMLQAIRDAGRFVESVE